MQLLVTRSQNTAVFGEDGSLTWVWIQGDSLPFDFLPLRNSAGGFFVPLIGELLRFAGSCMRLVRNYQPSSARFSLSCTCIELQLDVTTFIGHSRAKVADFRLLNHTF